MNANSSDLADIYIVSQAVITDSKPSCEILNEYEQDDTIVWVVTARGEKCSRCWKYRELNDEGICSDCAEAVN